MSVNHFWLIYFILPKNNDNNRQGNIGKLCLFQLYN